MNHSLGYLQRHMLSFCERYPQAHTIHNHSQAITELKRRKYPRNAARYIVHDPICLYSDGTIISPCRCTCGSQATAWTATLK
jgi:hypothetical protein